MLSGITGILWIFIFIVSICITIAPLLIWRNSNRTNRLLALLLAQNGTDPNLISKTYFGSGNDIEYPGIKELNYEEYTNGKDFKQCPKCGAKSPSNTTRCICNHIFDL